MTGGNPFKAGPITTASPIVREIFETLERRGVSMTAFADKTRITKQTLSTWRKGQYQPNIMGLEEMADALGMRVILVPKHKDVKLVPRKMRFGPDE